LPIIPLAEWDALDEADLFGFNGAVLASFPRTAFPSPASLPADVYCLTDECRFGEPVTVILQRAQPRALYGFEKRLPRL
jgi:hypothetical protein